MSDTMEDIFSPELRALMGEWATYFVVNSYRRVNATTEISDREFFETKVFESHIGGAFGETCHYLEELGLIVRTDKKNWCKATCAYSEIWNAIYSKFGTPKPESVLLFFDSANDWVGSPLSGSETEPFTIDDECIPLFNQLIQEKFVAVLGANYSWTSKIRPYLEAKRYWRPRDYSKDTTIEWSIIDNLDQKSLNALHEASSRGDKIGATIVLKNSPVFRELIKAKKRFSFRLELDVLDIMFPNAWREGKTSPLHWKWHGEIPSQFEP